MALTAVLPVWRSWHIDPATVLRQDASRGTESRGSLRLRNSFVVAEIALTLTLSVASVLTVRELLRESRESLGFAADNLVTLDMHTVATTRLPDFPNDGTPAQQEAAINATKSAASAYVQHLNNLLDTLRSVPGVTSAAAVLGAPMTDGGITVAYAVAGRQVFAPPFQGLPYGDVHTVTPGFFNTMGIPVLRGRSLSDADTLGSPLVVLISAALAHKIFPGQDPIGQRIVCGFDSMGDAWTIVGVTGDIRSAQPGHLPPHALYVPVAQHPLSATDMQLIVRTRGDAPAMADGLRRRLVETHPEVAVKSSTMLRDVDETERPQQFRTLLLSSFAAVSILLAMVGMYGVTSYSVAQRKFEFGLRTAVGASRGQLLAMVLRKATRTALLGVAVGVLLSLALGKVMSNMLGQKQQLDPLSFTIATAVVLAIALLATLIPARAAAAVDPMNVLRSE
jgi:putative ABC transport system permease protein